MKHESKRLRCTRRSESFFCRPPPVRSGSAFSMGCEVRKLVIADETVAAPPGVRGPSGGERADRIHESRLVIS